MFTLPQSLKIAWTVSTDKKWQNEAMDDGIFKDNLFFQLKVQNKLKNSSGNTGTLWKQLVQRSTE